MNSDAPLRDFQKSLLRARSEHAIQSIQVGILYVFFRTLLSFSLGRLIYLAGFVAIGWGIGFLLIAARTDRYMVPVYLLTVSGLLYTVRILVQAYTRPGPEARHRTLTRPLWSVVHFQRLMALCVLLPAVLPIAACGHLPRPGRYDSGQVAAVLAERQAVIDHYRSELALKLVEQEANAESDGVVAERKRLQRAKTIAEANAASDPWKRRMLLQYARDHYDGDGHERQGRKRDADAVAALTERISTLEAANAVLRRRGYLTELDRQGNETALLMRKP